MVTNELLIIDRASPGSGRGVEERALVAACAHVRRRRGWWAGLARGDSPEGRGAELRRQAFALLARDPQGRPVAWLGDTEHSRDRDPEDLARLAEGLVAGCAVIWVDPPPRGRRLARAWRALARAHARALLGRAAGLPEPLCRRLSSDEPAAIRRAVRAWLDGDETVAVDLVNSALVEHVIRGEPGYVEPGYVEPGFWERGFSRPPADSERG